MYDPGEKWETCPYNKAHVLLKSRIQFHLEKCRIQHPGLEKTPCPFNSTHVVNKVEYDYHIEQCPDRVVLDNFVMRVGPEERPVGLMPVENININYNDDECWDNESNGVNVLALVKAEAQGKQILIPKVGAPKAERKQHRIDERRRHAALSNNVPHSEAFVQPCVSPTPVGLPAQTLPKPQETKKTATPPPHMVEPKFVHGTPQPSSLNSVPSKRWTANTSVAPQVNNTQDFPALGTKGSRRDNDSGLQDSLNNLSLNPDMNEKPRPAPKQQDARSSVPATCSNVGSGNHSFGNPWSNRFQQASRSDSSGPPEFESPSDTMPPLSQNGFPSLPPGGYGRGRKPRK